MIEKPKQVTKGEKQIFTSEQYQQYAEEQFNNIYDYLNSQESSGGGTSGIFPVGAIYLSIDPTNPSTYFGGEWELIKDTFLLGAGDIYEAGSIGGEAEHALTIDEIPAHDHIAGTNAITYSGRNMGLPSVGFTDTFTNKFYTSETGGGEAHNNMPPYLVVYMWKRIN